MFFARTKRAFLFHLLFSQIWLQNFFNRCNMNMDLAEDNMKVLFSFKKHYRTILVFCALSITIAILFFALSACDDNGADESPIEVVSSNYEFSVDLSPKGKTEFYFTPKFSGDYVVTIDDENATFLIDGVEISERIVYFSKKEKYDIVFLSSQKSIKGSIAPQQVVETTMYVRRENDFVVKYVPKKSGTYLIDLLDEEYYLGGNNNNTTEITVYDKNFDKLDELQNRTYFFQQDEKERCYYIVVNNFNKYLDVSLDLTIGKVYSQVFVFQDKYIDYSNTHYSVSGKTGDIVYVYVRSLQAYNVKDILYIDQHAKIGENIQIEVLEWNRKNNLLTDVETDGEYQFFELYCKGNLDFSCMYWELVRLKIVFLSDTRFSMFYVL